VLLRHTHSYALPVLRTTIYLFALLFEMILFVESSSTASPKLLSTQKWKNSHRDSFIIIRIIAHSIIIIIIMDDGERKEGHF
jgi:hypothetical protein